MSELQFIVEHLNKKPFCLGLTLVAFDEKSNFELLQITHEVFVEIDPTRHSGVDLRAEADESRAQRYLEFLQLLKFPLPRDINGFREALAHGDRQTIDTLLYWALKSLPAHQKRAYLGRFLAPLNVPQEHFGDGSLKAMYENYQQLQDKFKVVHKEADQLRTSKSRPGELRREISQLEEESQQLTEKIANLKKKTTSNSGFQEILAATSALRKEQEEQAKLAERKRDQMLSLSLAEKRAQEAEARLQDLRASLSQNATPEQLFERLQSQVARNKEILSIKFPTEFKTKQETLQRLERTLSEPRKTEQDIDDMEDNVQTLKRAIQNYQTQIADAQMAQNNGEEDKLAVFRQHASLQARKLADKEGELEEQRVELERHKRSIEICEAKLASLSGTKFMNRDEFKQYATTLRNKTNQYKKVKAELAELAAESVVLHRTEQLLKSKDADLEGFLRDLERQKGVSGFFSTQEKIDDVSVQNARVNALKGETLEEISRVVTNINQALKERKNQLAPQIKELRTVRQRYQEMEQIYLERKSQYDQTAVGLEAERLKLEQECAAFQEDALREESHYHLLHCQLELQQGKANKVAHEVEFEQGTSNTRLLRDIRSFQELYKHKVAQQESLTKELRKQQKTLKSSAPAKKQQKEMFEGLYQLLACKARLAQQDSSSAGKFNRNSGSTGHDVYDSYNDIRNYHVGGANVMTLIAE
ncbi:uncharacterized protein PHALS_12463 [Plasmopara halstedii]|uniref:IFT81 calponin homology domain-containing protein n=1 Tax=Plasmopara halstedii TaxID=4781 RepID=A0A0P1AN33_PLAHL|nr:uncharacterized protein PHALS_12463 [Plasmopara halstedii]CEG42166.1 hypothetical protein PHALS_12463 [Plasmopara halstedii]|eukprot:XP_024578535.1 hypothetical protein PHALS_12463 [Plasmopara halstedii]